MPVNALFFGAIILLLGAIAFTIYLVLSCGDGVQDERGFHRVKRPANSDSEDESSDETDLPPFLSAH